LHDAPDTPAAGRPLRVVLVDDEPLAVDCMRLALARSPGVAVVAECVNGLSAVEAIRQHAPDLVFLDVQMPGLDGFGVIERIGVHAMPAVIFVTAFDAHAIRAFEVHALDYVLKPFNDDRLLAAVERARELVRDRRQGELGRRLASVVQGWYGEELHGEDDPAGDANGGAEVASRRALALVPGEDDAGAQPAAVREGNGSGRRAYIGRFAVRKDGRVRFISTGDVDWIEADGNYILLHVGPLRHRVRATLRGVSAELDPRTFVRIHRSVIVNVERIREMQPWFGGDYIAILSTGDKLKVSRMRAGQLLRPMS
jgi:two-component system, LytTR family, response regulator